MTKGRENDEVRKELLKNLTRANPVAHVATRLKVAVPYVQENLAKLIEEDQVEQQGTSGFRLVTRDLLDEIYDLNPDLQEDLIWSEDVNPRFDFLPKNVRNIWNFCFTEMVNNAIDHSEGDFVAVHLTTNALYSEIAIHDNGVGIFRKIQAALKLKNEQEAVLELAKGKFTTDPKRHSGLGVFYSSRMLDSFDILSGSVYFRHESGLDREWVLSEEKEDAGTTIFMALENTSKRTTKEVLDAFSDGRTLGFNKTIIPVALAQSGEEQLVSRSQAKRVLSRVDQFTSVVFDFKDVEMIGQGFADEIFRVFANSHPSVKITTAHTNLAVGQMIRAVQREARSQEAANRKATPISARKKISRRNPT